MAADFFVAFTDVLMAASYVVGLFGTLMKKFGVYAFVITLLAVYMLVRRIFGAPNAGSDIAGMKQKRIPGDSNQKRIGGT